METGKLPRLQIDDVKYPGLELMVSSREGKEPNHIYRKFEHYTMNSGGTIHRYILLIKHSNLRNIKVRKLTIFYSEFRSDTGHFNCYGIHKQTHRGQ